MKKISKIILMYPNFRWMQGYENRTLWKIHPYNLCLLSAMIDSKYDVKIIDANFDNISKEQFEKIIAKESPDVVGISIIANEYLPTGLIAALLVKNVSSNIKVILGGPSVIFESEYVISDPNIDYAILGEGEYIIRELCDHFNGECDFPAKGVLYKKDNKIIDNGRVDFIDDLDSLPLPSYHKIDFMKYAMEMQRESTDRPRDLPFARILTSRGCPFKCCFCAAGAVSGKKIRYRSPANIIEEIEFLIKNYGIKSLMIDDDNLLVDKARAVQFFKLMIEKKMNLKWNAMALAVFKLDDELLNLMKQSGCQYINIAIESGVTRVLKEIIHKPVNLSHAKIMVNKIKNLDIDVVANFVIGFPGETWREIRQTIEFAENLDVDYVKIFIATPFPHTDLYKTAKKQGALIEDYSINKHLWTDGFIKTDQFRPQDLRILRAYEWDRINFSRPERKIKICKMMGISEERLDQIRIETLHRANP